MYVASSMCVHGLVPWGAMTSAGILIKFVPICIADWHSKCQLDMPWVRFLLVAEQDLTGKKLFLGSCASVDNIRVIESVDNISRLFKITSTNDINHTHIINVQNQFLIFHLRCTSWRSSITGTRQARKWPWLSPWYKLKDRLILRPIFRQWPSCGRQGNTSAFVITSYRASDKPSNEPHHLWPSSLVHVYATGLDDLRVTSNSRGV